MSWVDLSNYFLIYHSRHFPKWDEMVILVRRFGSCNDGTQSDSAWARIGDGIDCVESERRTKTDVQLVCTHKNPSAVFQSPSNGLINDATMPHRNHSSLNRRSSLIRGECFFLGISCASSKHCRASGSSKWKLFSDFLREKKSEFNRSAVDSIANQRKSFQKSRQKYEYFFAKKKYGFSVRMNDESRLRFAQFINCIRRRTRFCSTHSLLTVTIGRSATEWVNYKRMRLFYFSLAFIFLSNG